METLKKLFTVIRGSVRESAECVIDGNAVRILGQEIHESEVSISRAKNDLAKVIAERIHLQREIGWLQASISDYEARAVSALKNNLEADAERFAQWIAENEPVLHDLENKHAQLELYEADLNENLKSVIRQINHYRRELRLVQATNSSQKASAYIQKSTDNLDSRLLDMQSTLQRIHLKQQEFTDFAKARNKVDQALETSCSTRSGFDLLEKLTAQDVLKRLKAL